MHPELLKRTVKACRDYIDAGDCHGEAPSTERLIDAVVQLADALPEFSIIPAAGFDAQGFYGALERAARARGKTMLDVSGEANVRNTVLVRLGQGVKPDLASLDALCRWAGLNAADYMPRRPPGDRPAAIPLGVAETPKRYFPATDKELHDALVEWYQQSDGITVGIPSELVNALMERLTDGVLGTSASDPGCICRGNWRDIVKKTEHLIGRYYRRQRDGVVFHFFGIVYADDDYYYGMWEKTAGLYLMSCVGRLGEGMELLEPGYTRGVMVAHQQVIQPADADGSVKGGAALDAIRQKETE